MTDLEMDVLIKKSLNVCLTKNPGFQKTESLIVTSYSALTAFYVEKKPYVLLSAPTGTGKSIIGQLVHFCCNYIDTVIEGYDPLDEEDNLAIVPAHSYFLTSSKVLQDQLEGDFERFDINNYFTMLKGTSNYECTEATEMTKVKTMYPDRICLGMKAEEKKSLDCYPTCPYISKRYEAAGANCTVLNYSYFINVLKMKMNPFFAIRPLVIADEAHLIPDIVLSHFNIVFTQYHVNKIAKIYYQIDINFKNLIGKELAECLPILIDCYRFFSVANPSLDSIREYFGNFTKLLNWLATVTAIGCKNAVFKEMFFKEVNKILEENKNLDYGDYLDSLQLRPDDLFIESEFIGNHVFGNESYKIFKHTVNDMSEAEMCRNNFLTKINKGLFMSATLGNIDEFAALMGMKKEEYSGFRLQSNFDFTSSPINLCKSGYLNYANFNTNITKILSDTLQICEKIHPKEKGIIHTATFDIANRLKERVMAKMDGVEHPNRYLFYSNTEEKENRIMMMKTADISIPYIIIGPSLYEGLDLLYDQGRFNIVMKAPYSGMSEYIKKKMTRFAFWYERQTLEKLVQAIGRTNRRPDDKSITYLLDTSLEKLIFKTQEFITKRIRYHKL